MTVKVGIEDLRIQETAQSDHARHGGEREREWVPNEGGDRERVVNVFRVYQGELGHGDGDHSQVLVLQVNPGGDINRANPIR